MLKKILFIVALVFVLALCIGIYMFNKGPVNVADAGAEKISTTALYHAFDTDSAGAAKKYAGRVLEVTGILESISLNQKQQKILLLKSGSDGASVNCTMEEKQTNAEAGQNIIVKGICSGIGQGDADLGIKGDVYLSRCITLK